MEPHQNQPQKRFWPWLFLQNDTQFLCWHFTGKKTFQFLYFALCLQFSCSLICKIWFNALRMMSPNRSPSSSQSFCKNNFCFGLIYGSCWIAGLVYQLCCQLLIKVNFMKGMFFFLATGLTLHRINEILSFTNRTSIQSFSHWALNIGRAEIWKMNWWFLSFIMNELLSQCNLSTLPNCGSRCSRLASLRCLKQEEGQSKFGLAPSPCGDPRFQSWNHTMSRWAEMCPQQL